MKIKLSGLLLLSILLVAASGRACKKDTPACPDFGNEVATFTAALDTDKYETASSVLELPCRQYLVIGDTSHTPDQSVNGYAVQLGTHGEIVKERVFNTAGDEYFYTILPAVDEGFIVLGLSRLPGEENWDLYLLKLDNNLDAQWSKRYGNPGMDNCNQLITTEDGCYVIAGNTIPPGRQDSEFYLVKLDKKGRLLWAETYGTAGNDTGRCVIQTEDEGFILGGYGGADNPDVYLVKTDKRGKLQWMKNTGHAMRDMANAITSDAGGNVLVTGLTEYQGKEISQLAIYTVKFDTAGNVLWEKIINFEGRKVSLSQSIDRTLDGNFIIGGSVQHNYDIGFDLCLVKLDPAGNILWQRIFPVEGMEYCNAVLATSDGGYLTAGYLSSEAYIDIGGTMQLVYRGRNGFAIKYDSNGELKE